MKNKGRFLKILVVFLCVGLGGLLLLNNKIGDSFLPQIESVGAGFFDFSKKKIPFNAKTIDFTFSQKLDKTTVLRSNISVSPKIDGTLSLVSGNIIRFSPVEKMKLGENYIFTLSDKIKKDSGGTLSETTFEIDTVAGAKVVKITPEGKLKNLNQNFAVFFNVPMVPLTDLDSRDLLPCPIRFTPEVKGKCSWTTTSVLEFIPEKRLFGATDYIITVEDKKGLLYPLVEAQTAKLQTPLLQFYFNEKFDVKKGIQFSSNFDVTLEEIQKKLQLEIMDNSKTKVAGTRYKKLNFSVTKNKNTFIVNLKNEKFTYNFNYYLSFKESVHSKNGNIIYNIGHSDNIKERSMRKKRREKNRTEKNKKNSIKRYRNISNHFLEDTKVVRNIYSSTGTLIDTSNVYINHRSEYNKYLPTKNIFFQLNFAEEVPLKKEFFSFGAGDGERIAFDIEYIKEERFIKDKKGNPTEKKETITNKKNVKLTLKQPLQNNKTYNLVIAKNINTYLNNDISTIYYSSKQLKITDFHFMNYKKSCVYTSAPLINFWRPKKSTITTIPATRSMNINTSDYIRDQYIRDTANKMYNYDEKKAYLLKNGFCSPARSGEYLYVLQTRLNPHTKYSIVFHDTLTDRFANTLKKERSFSYTTGEIKNSDKTMVLSVNKLTNVIPKKVPIVINIKTTHLESLNLDVCELNSTGYIEYIKKRGKAGYKPLCVYSQSGTVKLRNKNWYATHNTIDIENDFLDKDFEENFILVRGSMPYGNSKFENVYIRENLSVTFEEGKNKQLLFVTDFAGKQVTDVQFSFYKWNATRATKQGPRQYELKKVALNPQLNPTTQVFELSAPEGLFDYIVVRQKGKNTDNIGLIHLHSDKLSNYAFNYISGSSSSQKEFLYLYTERPIYKPSDTVFVKGLLRNFTPTGYTPTSIKKGTLSLIGPSGKTIATQDVVIGKNSNFDTKFLLPKEVPLGTFRFRFSYNKNKVDKNVNKNSIVQNNAYFNIEEYRKPTFKVNVEKKPHNKNDFVLGETSTLLVQPEYYFGGKMKNTTGEYRVLTQNYFFDAKDYSDYQFGEGYGYFDCIYWGSCNYSDNLEKTGDFKINEQGEYTMNFEFPGKKREKKISNNEKTQKIGEKVYSFYFAVTDPDTKRMVGKTISQVLHTTDAYVGMQSKYYNNLKSGISLDGVVLDFDAQPLSNKKVKIEVINNKWKSVKKKGVDGIFYYDYSQEQKLESTEYVTTDNKGKFVKNIITKTSGEYLIKVYYTGANKKSFVSSRGVYVAGKDYVEWHINNNDVTEFVAEKVQVKIGDTAEYMLKSPINSGKALIVIEKDDGILDYFVHDISSYSDKIVVDVKEEYYPNYYIKAFLIGGEKKNPLPIYKRALAITKVNTEYKKLHIKILPNKKNYLPGAQVALKIEVTDYYGKPVSHADLSISLVDESLLALKGNPKKNPYAFFYDLKRYLGISTYTSLKKLVKKLEIKNSRNGEKGGAGESVKGGDSKKKRGLFKDTAFWNANVMTDKNGIAHITTAKLPDNLTTWVIEVLANTANDTKIGVNYESIITSKKLLISDNLPRFFGSNDVITLSPVVFNTTGKDQDINVTLDATAIKNQGKKTQKVHIKNGDSKTLMFTVKVDDIALSETQSLFHSKINILAQATQTDDRDEVEKFIQIQSVSTPEFVSTTGKTNSTSFEEKINVGNIKNSAGKLTINYSATLLSSLLDSVEYLQRYPYGCSEQRTSAILPNIFIKKLHNSIGKEFDLKKKMVKYWFSHTQGFKEKSLDQIIKEYGVNIQKYQKNDGGFVYFYKIANGPNYSNFALTSYILSSASHMRDVGYVLDTATYKKAQRYLKTRFYKNYREGCNDSEIYKMGTVDMPYCKYSETERLQALVALLEYDNNDYEVYKMYKLLDFTKINSSLQLEKVKAIAKIIKIQDISDIEKRALKKEAKDIINVVISEELVFNPKGAYIGKTQHYSRLKNTLSLLESVSLIGLDEFKNIETIINSINRWIFSQKKNGSFGSTSDNISLIKTITTYMESSGELKNVKNSTTLKLNNETIAEKRFTNANKLEVFTHTMNLDDIQDSNSFHIEKVGSGSIYYDLNLSYYKDARDIIARDEGFFIETHYYKYSEYKEIERVKKEEWKKHIETHTAYDDLKYPKEIFAYLTPVVSGKVGELLVVHNKVITTETRDKVALEGFIPSGAELINPNLATSPKISQIQKSQRGRNRRKMYSQEAQVYNSYTLFDTNEYRSDRFFAYKRVIYPGIHTFSYLIRLTHAGEYSIKPTRISEFYNVEVFGRTQGKRFKIEK